MMSWVQGIHHVTAAATSAQGDHDFHTGTLGLRLVKRTVNHETADQWHLFYGDDVGNAGSIMTNFIFEDVPLPAYRRGRGTITEVAYSAPPESMQFWRRRLGEAGALDASGEEDQKAPERFGDLVLRFRDRSGIPGEIVACDDSRAGSAGTEEVPREHSLRGLHSVTLLSRIPELTIGFFCELLRFQVAGVEGSRTRLRAPSGGPGSFVDVLDEPDAPWGRWGLGGIHHVAFTVPSRETMEQLARVLSGAGLILTDLRDRKWFHSMYLTEPGGINVEFSDLSPGWTIDEEPQSLGTTLCLPKQWEAQRAEIEARLPVLEF
ncbi:MAG: ring-cleaving dioxygenase [Acidobacteria bacterium]|nr:MAG: ring-cleaving dioxygenase [Acidobacteriota bacterium]REK11485.1 MAG: ring-cleaving dioxygenase [Acidobacteriota bacterium]